MGDLPDEEEIGNDDDLRVENKASCCTPAYDGWDCPHKGSGDNSKGGNAFEIGINDVVPKDIEKA